jgi:hypothetical protein
LGSAGLCTLAPAGSEGGMRLASSGYESTVFTSLVKSFLQRLCSTAFSGNRSMNPSIGVLDSESAKFFCYNWTR